MPKNSPNFQESLQAFAAAVTAKMAQLTPGEPEDQIRTPFDNFMTAVGAALDWKVECKGETPLPHRIGRPDYAVHLNRALTGFVELKAPGVGATATRFKGHNRNQFNRFKAIPNLLYTDGNEWALYRSGELADKVVRLSGDVGADGTKAAKPRDAQALERLLRDFLSWEPLIPTDRKGKIDLKGFAEMLAPLTRMMRDDVTDALQDADSPLRQLAKEWRQLLFPDASDEQFADAYAQTVAFALLLGRSEGADPLTRETAEKALAAQHNLLSRALDMLTDPQVEDVMGASLALLIRVIGAVSPGTFAGPEDPWLYFYEDFLAAYDPKLRKDVGAYYTPIEVVRCQVRLIEDLLINRLHKPLGFADPGVVTLDPAAGTGTYLLGVIEHALKRIESEQGTGAVPGQATQLARNLYGFELMVGPYAVTELRVSRALKDYGANLPKDGTHIYLTDTLESPHTEPRVLALSLKAFSDQHRKALEVKSKVPVIVCLGNPPYDRHEAVEYGIDEEGLAETGRRVIRNTARTGGWVRWGDTERGTEAIFNDFLEPAKAAGHGVHLKNLYNLYVYFWRWALWKVFEHETASGPGVVSFISASSYLDGDAFSGMREHMRRVCDAIWILDLGGEGRGTRKSDNVFAIQTPVAIAVTLRTKKPKNTKPATVWYASIEGNRSAKLATLGSTVSFSDVKWLECPAEWQAPFRPAGSGQYFMWSLLTDLMPWQQSGVKAGRTWVISPDESTLKECWRMLVSADSVERKTLFKDSPTGRKVHQAATQLPPLGDKLRPLSELNRSEHTPTTMRYAYRSFDRQYIFADARMLDRPGPGLWRTHSDRQVYLTTLFSQALGSGPALVAAALIPDLDHFRGSYGAKATIPFLRSANAMEANILPGLLELLGERFRCTLMPDDFLAYIYGLLAHPAFTRRFNKELETRELRVPITKNVALFKKARDLGAHLLWLHTYGERFIPKGTKRGQIPRGAARCTRAVPGHAEGYPEDFEHNEKTRTLHVGDGEFAPVPREVFEFEVSGLKVVQSWLKYRMKKGAGKKSSPLDDIRPTHWTSQFTTELLELLWVLEATVEGYPEQAKLLQAVIESECFTADELPPVPDEMRKPPAARKPGADLFDEIEEE